MTQDEDRPTETQDGPTEPPPQPPTIEVTATDSAEKSWTPTPDEVQRSDTGPQTDNITDVFEDIERKSD